MLHLALVVREVPSPLSALRIHGCVAQLISFARNFSGVDGIAERLPSAPINLETFSGPARHDPSAMTRFDGHGDATEVRAHCLSQADLLGVHFGRIRREC